MTGIEIHEPRSLDEAVSLLNEFGNDAKVIAGGTALVIMLRNGLLRPARLVSLCRLSDLNYVRPADGGISLGATTTIRQAERHRAVRRLAPALAEAFGHVANVRVRHAATVGGNLAEADYASDPPSMLTALGATVAAHGPGGSRTIPIGTFFRGFYETALEPEEIITEIHVPPLPEQARAAFVKFVSRSSEDRPCVSVAAVVGTDEGGYCSHLRVVVGGVAEVPEEHQAILDSALDRKLDVSVMDDLGAAYADAADPIEDMRGSAWYRRRMIRVCVRRALEAAWTDVRRDADA